MKKALFFLPVLLMATSCQFFDSKVPSEEELLQKRLKEINWDEVSTYPSISICEGILDREQKRECFFSSMAHLIQQKLNNDTIATLYPETDTIMVKVTIYPNATLKIEPQAAKDSVAYDKMSIDSILSAKLSDFPKVEPAQKEGIPVTTQFFLPVILNFGN